MDLVALGIVFGFGVFFVFTILPSLFNELTEAMYLVVSAVLCIEILQLMILIYMVARRE